MATRSILDRFRSRLRRFLALAAWASALLAGLAADSASAATNTAFVFDRIYLRHQTGSGHPERPERLTAIVDRFKQTKLIDRLLLIKPTPTTTNWVATIHRPSYIEHVRAVCAAGPGHLDSGDTPVSRDSFEVALAAAGGVQAAIDAVMDGRVRNAFCAIRPPGHHALKDRAMGFCLFNNVAIAARYLQLKYKLTRILIVDWDVHHGNGTQDAFYEDPTVFYFSTHQSPFYPGSGAAEETGAGKGLGFTCNVPLPAGSGDAEYRKAYEEQLKPAAAKFKPDFVLVSAGFDSGQADLLGGMRVTPAGFEELTRIVKGIAEQHCRGRLVSMLEGGYNLETLAASAEAHVRELMR